MIQQDIQVTNRLGIHARPAALITQTACGFVCDIRLAKDNITVDAKSIMGVFSLDISQPIALYIYNDETAETVTKAISSFEI